MQIKIIRRSLYLILILIVSFNTAISRESQSVPDWSGIWERVEGNAGMFDISSTEPHDGRAGSPGVRQFPPLTKEWEEKYKYNLELVALDRLPDPISV